MMWPCRIRFIAAALFILACAGVDLGSSGSVSPPMSSEEELLLGDGAVSSEDIGGGGGGGQLMRRRPAAALMRPSLSISEKILPIQLVDTTEDQVRVPRRKQLRAHTLMTTLGKDFEPSWMAVEKPAVLIEEPATVSDGLLQSSPKLLTEVRRLNLTDELPSLPLSSVHAVEDWLVKKASCPVRYVWDDVGPLFWPPWIKRGECVNEAGRTCSWPLGMHCVPAESITIHLLRWHCRPRSRKATGRATGGGNGKHLKQFHKQYRCQWLKVPYPVTAECFCSC